MEAKVKMKTKFSSPPNKKSGQSPDTKFCVPIGILFKISTKSG